MERAAFGFAQEADGIHQVADDRRHRQGDGSVQTDRGTVAGFRDDPRGKVAKFAPVLRPDLGGEREEFRRGPQAVTVAERGAPLMAAISPTVSPAALTARSEPSTFSAVAVTLAGRHHAGLTGWVACQTLVNRFSSRPVVVSHMTTAPVTVAGSGGDSVDYGKAARMSGEDTRRFASNNPYGDEYQRQWSRQAPAGRTPAGGGGIDLETAQRMMAEEAARYRARTEPTPAPGPGPAGQGSTLPGYQTQAATWERPSGTWVAAAEQDAEDQLRQWNRAQGRGTPEADPNQTMDPAQAAAAVAASGTWQQPAAPSYQQDQFQGYAGGATLSPDQAAHFSRQMAQSESYSAYQQAQAFSAADFPGADFQGQSQPQNTYARHANDSVSQFGQRNPGGTGLSRRSAVSRRTRGDERPQRRHARGGSGG
ncbi:hypothetical protein [Streptomyces niveus]|uniref:hypothetical protein n=1 Tax=Streptomyces niveus TaxID=193462 RepID=UPI003F4D0DB8